MIQLQILCDHHKERKMKEKRKIDSLEVEIELFLLSNKAISKDF